MISQYISNLIGNPPSGYEALQYMINGVVLIFLVTLGYRFITAVFGGYKK